MSDDNEIEEMTSQVVSMFEELDAPDRAVMLQELAAKWCVSCGDELPDDGECPCTDEEAGETDDEDETEDEDETDDDE